MKGMFFCWVYRIEIEGFFLIYSTPVLHRCIPTGKNAPGEQVRDMYDLVNSWSAAQQLLSDLYITWPIILIMCFGALCKYFNKA